MTRNENLIDKPLPSSDEAETVILGGTLLDNAVFEDAYRQLSAEDFYSPLHRRVFSAMGALFEMQKPIDPVTISEVLKAEGSLESIGGMQRVTQLAFGLPSYKNLNEYIAIVKQHSVRRAILRICNNISGEILSGDDDVSVTLEDMEASILKVSGKLHTESKVEEKAFWSLADIVPSLHDQLQNYHDGIQTGVKTGMDEVDDLLDGGGLQAGGLYVVAAGEKTGKTSLALDWAYDIAARQGFTVPIVTLEMSKITMAKRILSAHTGVPYFTFRPGMYDAQGSNYFTKALDGLTSMAEIPITIADKLYSMDQIKRHCNRAVELGIKTGKEVGAIVLDYLQLITLFEKSSSRADEVAKISREVKKLGTDLEKPIIIISSLNRLGLTEGQEPDTFNLRDSGTIGFDAEAVFFLHNPAYHPGKPYMPQEVTDMNLILSRQRNGPTGRIAMKLIGPYMQFMTEKQFRIHFGDPNTDSKVPQSTGEYNAKQKALTDMWDTEDDDEWV